MQHETGVVGGQSLRVEAAISNQSNACSMNTGVLLGSLSAVR